MKNAIRIMLIVCSAAVSQASAQSGGSHRNGDAPTGVKESAPKLAATRIRMKCQVCKGRGELKVRPPDVGQYGGLITNRSRWDVKLDPCPVCGKGHGRCTVWDLSYPEPSAEPPCTTCGWSGIVQCRKCLASGVVTCYNRDCQDGWILPKGVKVGRRSSSKVKHSEKIRPSEITPCPQCQGAGRVKCAECQGMRANPCRRCHGTGRKSR